MPSLRLLSVEGENPLVCINVLHWTRGRQQEQSVTFLGHNPIALLGGAFLPDSFATGLYSNRRRQQQELRFNP